MEMVCELFAVKCDPTSFLSFGIRYPILTCQKSWGICVDDGWYTLLLEMNTKIASIISDNNLRPRDHVAYQVKEKLGTLRVYHTSRNAEILEAVERAYAISVVTCEKCGERGEKKMIGGWIMVRCVVCEREERERREGERKI